jgi:hypothetical protein
VVDQLSFRRSLAVVCSSPLTFTAPYASYARLDLLPDFRFELVPPPHLLFFFLFSTILPTSFRLSSGRLCRLSVERRLIELSEHSWPLFGHRVIITIARLEANHVYHCRSSCRSPLCPAPPPSNNPLTTSNHSLFLPKHFTVEASWRRFRAVHHSFRSLAQFALFDLSSSSKKLHTLFRHPFVTLHSSSIRPLLALCSLGRSFFIHRPVASLPSSHASSLPLHSRSSVVLNRFLPSLSIIAASTRSAKGRPLPSTPNSVFRHLPPLRTYLTCSLLTF